MHSCGRTRVEVNAPECSSADRETRFRADGFAYASPKHDSATERGRVQRRATRRLRARERDNSTHWLVARPVVVHRVYAGTACGAAPDTSSIGDYMAGGRVFRSAWRSRGCGSSRADVDGRRRPR